MSEFTKRLLKNVGFNAVSVVASRVGALIFTIIVARLLNPELFGLYNLALAIGIMLITFADAGTGATMVRYISAALGQGNKTKARSDYLFLLKIRIVFTLAFAAAVFVSSSLIAQLLNKPALSVPLQAVAIYILSISFLGYFKTSFYALQEVRYASLGEIIFQIARLIIVPIVIFTGYSLFGIIVGLALAAGIAGGVLLILLLRKFRYLLEGRNTNVNRRKLFYYLSYIMASSLSFIFFINIDTLMLGALVPAAEIGYYRAASSLVFSVPGLLGIAGVLFPVFSQMRGEKLRESFQKVFKYSAILSIPASFGIMFLARPLIRTIFGPEYLAAELALVILSLVIFESATGGLFMTLLNSQELQKWPARAIIFSLILNVALNYWLIPLYGIAGAAIATVTSRYVNTALLGVIVHIKLRITIPRELWKSVVSTAVMVLTLMYVLPDPQTITVGVFTVLMAGAIYLTSMFLLKGVSHSEVSRLLARR